jgi:hypothetical protein
LAIVTLTGATALSIAACGPSNDAKPTSANPTSSAPSSSSPSASAKGKDWVNGLIDSVSGNTIQVSQRSGSATVDFTPSTAISEIIPARVTDVTNGGETPAAHHQIGGQVASVAGNTITVNNADSAANSSQISVTVTDTTKYTKRSTADARAIAQGKCIAAHGTTDGGGTLQATSISVQQSDNGSCPQLGGKHHRH